ncbi:MAG: hypothetical protein L0H63_13650 [Nitrococcus sp.]|nr:hypothetical protein [Nitrococcus sp.]
MTATFSGAQIVPRLAGIIGTSLPAGTSVTCSYIRTGDASYGYQSQTLSIVQRRDGVNVVWFALPEGVDACYGVRFTFDASALLTSSGLLVEIGEIWVGPGSSLCITPDYSASNDSHSDIETSVNGQPFRVERQSSTLHKLKLAPSQFSDVFGDVTADIAFIRQACNEYRPCVVVPMTTEAYTGNADNSAIINHQAAFGYVRSIDAIAANPAPLFSASMDFVEIPAWIP